MKKRNKHNLKINRLEVYTDADMTSFGRYLLSKERRDLILSSMNIQEFGEFDSEKFNHPEIPFIEKYQEVSHADFENWKNKYNNGKIS